MSSTSVATSSRHRSSLREQACAAAAAGDYPRELELLREDAEHGDVEGLAPLARLYERRGKTPQAIATYTRLADLDDPQAPLHLGELHLGQGRVDDAMAWFKRAADSGSEAAPAGAAELGALLLTHGTGEHAVEEAVRYLRSAGLGEVRIGALVAARHDAVDLAHEVG